MSQLSHIHDMCPVREPRDAKMVEPATRKIPHVASEKPLEALGFGWKRDVLDYGRDGKATIYQQGDAIVTRSPGSLDVEAIDSPEVHRQLAYLFGFFERGVK